jgi:hypothetical protein
MIDELEEEISEWRAIILRTNAHKLKDLESDHANSQKELATIKKQLEESQKEIRKKN